MASNVINNLKDLRPDLKIHQNLGYCGEKVRYVDEKSDHLMLRVDRNKSPTPISFKDVKSVLKKNPYDGVVISDYNKGSLSESVINDICSFCRVPIFMDTKKTLGEWSKDCDYVKINDTEYNNNLKNLKEKPQNYCRKLIVTLGKSGSVLYDGDSTVTSEGKSFGKMVDVSGAGDSFFAAFIIKYLETANDIVAMDYANTVAAIAVTKPMVSTVSEKEIDTYLKKGMMG
jgi:D-beta-D-heptose 7-phosphate kinase/D-beta-D-heptose 1-phosphate adenosyltransferase